MDGNASKTDRIDVLVIDEGSMVSLTGAEAKRGGMFLGGAYFRVSRRIRSAVMNANRTRAKRWHLTAPPPEWSSSGYTPPRRGWGFCKRHNGDFAPAVTHKM